jgi:phosphoribosyl 1,2-cyclic phosphate phosphodiesterase
LKVTFLGTGTSQGVPTIGCRCEVCRSEDPRDKRWRPSVLLALEGGAHVLVDTSSDLRAQALRFGVDRVDAILYTHSHADHILGFDDTRPFTASSGTVLPVYGDARTLGDLRRTFAYAFDTGTDPGGGLPQVVTYVVAGPFCIGGREIVPVPIMHGRRAILGYRVGGFAYLTDCSHIPEPSFDLLQGLEVVVLGALRHRPHPTHFTVAEAAAAAARIGARRTYLTHMCHDLGHAATSALLPPAVWLAHDGLTLEVA